MAAANVVVMETVTVDAGVQMRVSRAEHCCV